MNGICANQKGFSLVEVLVAMTLGLLVLAGVSQTFVVQQRVYDVQDEVNVAIQTGRAIIDCIANDLIMAGYNPQRASDFDDPLVSSHTGIVYIKSDLNENGVLDADDERVGYYFSPNNKVMLRYTIQKAGWDYLADNIENFEVRLLDKDGNVAASNDEVRIAEVKVVTRTPNPDPRYKANGGYRTFTFETKVAPPNVGLPTI